MSIEIEEIKKVSLSESDVLILHVDHLSLSTEQRASIADNFNVVFPNNRVVVLDKGFSISVLTKEEIIANTFEGM